MKAGTKIRTGRILDLNTNRPTYSGKGYYEEAIVEAAARNKPGQVYARIINGANRGYANWFDLSKVSPAQ